VTARATPPISSAAKRHTFVVVAYGDSPHLDECLTSVVNQKAASSVVVATSTPSEHIVACAARHRVRVACNPEKKGIASDWNFGLQQAPLGLVTLAHQDDVYDAEFAAQTLELFGRRPDATLCFTGYEEISRGKRVRNSRVLRTKEVLTWLVIGRRRVIDERWRRRLLLSFGSLIPCPSVTFNLDRLGEFGFSEDFSINLDWDAWWRLHSEDAPFLRVPHILMAHRVGDGTETTEGKRDGRRQREDARMFERVWPAPVAALLSLLYRSGY
jgi:hypothetical protein